MRYRPPNLLLYVLALALIAFVACRRSAAVSSVGKDSGARHLLSQGFAADELAVLYPDRRPAGYAMLLGFDQVLQPKVLGKATLGAYARERARAYPAAVTAIGLYVDAAFAPGVLEGEFDREIAELADTLALLTGETYLSIGLNVDSPVWAYEPMRFRKTYAYVASRLRPKLPASVRLTWYVNGAGPSYGDVGFAEYYPGDADVDALAFNVTRVRPEDFADHFMLKAARYDSLLAFAKTRSLPVLVLDSSADTLVGQQNLDGPAAVAAYYDPFFDMLTASPQIRYYTHQNRFLSDSTVAHRWRLRLRTEGAASNY